MNPPPDANPETPAEVPSPKVPPASPAPAPAPAPPPAAALVAHGTASEETLQLRRDLETERKARRDAETKAAEAEKLKQDLLAVTQREPEKPVRQPAPRRRFATLLNHDWNR